MEWADLIAGIIREPLERFCTNLAPKVLSTYVLRPILARRFFEKGVSLGGVSISVDFLG
jgi:hypothetical protein